MPSSPTPSPDELPPRAPLSVLAWSARRRMLVVLPAVLALWLAVAWAQLEAAPW
jgi:uncharacterized protein involved in exopolysaccharide biosynthesis